MTLAPGTRRGSFEVLSPLGAGGMGEVYRARDTRLGRDVAIKTLPEELGRESERLVRFQREARLLAALNHPNIAAIYGIEEAEGDHYLILDQRGPRDPLSQWRPMDVGRVSESKLDLGGRPDHPREYGVSPDGNEIIAMRTALPPEPERQLAITSHWLQTLNDRAVDARN
jgi:hypothetical protein